MAAADGWIVEGDVAGDATAHDDAAAGGEVEGLAAFNSGEAVARHGRL